MTPSEHADMIAHVAAAMRSHGLLTYEADGVRAVLAPATAPVQAYQPEPPLAELDRAALHDRILYGAAEGM